MDEEEKLECPVCMDPYNEGSHSPKMMSCLHTLCATCIVDVVLTGETRTGNIYGGSLVEPSIPSGKCFPCPLCRETIMTDRVQTNRYILAHLRDIQRLSARNNPSTALRRRPLAQKPPPLPQKPPTRLSCQLTTGALEIPPRPPPISTIPTWKEGKVGNVRSGSHTSTAKIQLKRTKTPKAPKDPPPPPPNQKKNKEKQKAPPPPTSPPRQGPPSYRAPPPPQHPRGPVAQLHPIWKPAEKYPAPHLLPPPSYNPYYATEPNNLPILAFEGQSPSYNPYYVSGTSTNGTLNHPMASVLTTARRMPMPTPPTSLSMSPNWQPPSQTSPTTPVAGSPTIIPKLPPATTFHQRNPHNVQERLEKRENVSLYPAILEDTTPSTPSAPAPLPDPNETWCRTCEEPGKMTCDGHDLVPLLKEAEVDVMIELQREIEKRLEQETKDFELARTMQETYIEIPSTIAETPATPPSYEPVVNNGRTFDLRLNSWAELRDAVNTSCDSTLLMECFKEFDRRHIEYRRTIKRKGKKTRPVLMSFLKKKEGTPNPIETSHI